MILHHLCIETNDYESSVSFYKKVFNAECIKENKNFHNRDYISWFSIGSIKIELQTPKHGENSNESETNKTGIVHVAFYVENLDEEYKRLKDLNINSFVQKNGSDIYEVLGKKLMKIVAPEGTIIELRDSDITEKDETL